MTSAYSLSPAEQQTVQEYVVGSLKDPDSARFGQIAAAKADNGTIYVCGYVNARNSFGGYTGMQPYLGQMIGPVFKVQWWGNTRPMVDYVLDECHKAGVTI